MRLQGKVAIITGGGSGIGLAIAQAFVEEGAVVTICGRNASRLEAAAKQLGKSCLAVRGDVSSADEIGHVVAETIKRWSRIDVLVNNAAVLHPGTAESITEAAWDESFNVNVRGLWLMSRATLPHLRAAGGGSIVNIASVLSGLGAKNRVAYAASKGAVLSLTRAMALDHAAECIRVNCICPGIVETELVAEFNKDPHARSERLAKHPAGRFGQPKDIAGAAVYLAGDDSAWVTGSAITVDGGYSAQ